jgi:hypothetical protein
MERGRPISTTGRPATKNGWRSSDQRIDRQIDPADEGHALRNDCTNFIPNALFSSSDENKSKVNQAIYLTLPLERPDKVRTKKEEERKDGEKASRPLRV